MNPVADILEIPMVLAGGSDRDLLERFRHGDHDAFTALYRTHSPAVFRFAFHLTGDRARATEVTQDVFVWLIRHPSGFNPDRGKLAHFLAGVVRQIVRQRERAERRWLPFTEASPHPVDSWDPARTVDAGALRRAVALLPLRYREPVVLCDLEGRSYEEAAALLQCAVGTIRSRLHRAHELLARKFQPRKNQ
jgi:RNA polymerase sigma-70 factor (ECF subfamily)